MNSTIDDLYEALDKAAIKLLGDAMGGELPAEGGDATLPAAGGSLNERTRVFSAISAYAKSRQSPEGGKPSKSGKFNEFREQFRGTVSGNGEQRPSTKRRTRGAPASPTASAIGAASGQIGT